MISNKKPKKSNAIMPIYNKTVQYAGRSRILVAVLLLSMMLWVLGCSSGTDDSGPVTDNGLTYSGTTRMAAISEANARTLAGEAYRGSQSQSEIMPLTLSESDSQNQTNAGKRPLLLDLSGILLSSVEHIDPATDASIPIEESSAAGKTTVRRPGDCGGSAGHMITFDPASGLFSGSVSFFSFCNHDINLEGDISFSGNYNDSSGRADWFAIIFSNLSLTADGQSYALDGELDCELNGIEHRIFLDMLIRNDETAQVSWLNNYNLDVSGNRYMLSGRYYDPNFGYVDFSTAEGLTIGAGNDYPDAGAIVLTGRKGPAGGPTSARLQAISATHCRLQADTSGNGSFDYDSGEIRWVDL
jgi:hypothetical protein